MDGQGAAFGQRMDAATGPIPDLSYFEIGIVYDVANSVRVLHDSWAGSQLCRGLLDWCEWCSIACTEPPMAVSVVRECGFLSLEVGSGRVLRPTALVAAACLPWYRNSRRTHVAHMRLGGDAMERLSDIFPRVSGTVHYRNKMIMRPS